jgi:release factor glutamine methyltransferase
MRADALIDEAVAKLEASEAIDHWQPNRERIEAEELLAHVMGGEEPEPDDVIPAATVRRFRGLVERRVTGEPLPFIEGVAIFRDIELLAVPGVFVPRDSSEFLAEQAVQRLRRRSAPVLVDLATGGGAIALAVADEVAKAEVVGSDISEEAIALARKNARRLALRARFSVGDLFEKVPRRLRGEVDVVTLHPPYVALPELDDLPGEIRDWEPRHTLTDNSADGLELVRRTADEAPRWLAPTGWLLVEVSPDRARAVKTVLSRAGFRDVRSTRGGELQVTRVIVGRCPA